MIIRHPLEVYDLTYTRLAVLTDNTEFTAKSIREELKLNAIPKLSFAIPLDSPKTQYLLNENLVRYKDEYYYIKIPQFSHNQNMKQVVVECSHLSSGLEGISCPPLELIGKTATELLNGILSSVQTGWTLGTVNVPDTERRSLIIEEQSVFSNITKVAELFDAVLTFNSRSRTIDITTVKKNRNIQIRKGKNLQSIDLTYDSSELVTILTPFGGDDENGEQVHIMSVNPTGKSFIENYDYYLSLGYTMEYIKAHPENFHRDITWEATDYVSPQPLYDDAVKKLSNISKPIVRCIIKGVDLVDFPEYFMESATLGEIVYTVDEDLELVLEAQVTEIKTDSDKPIALEITISNELSHKSIVQQLVDSSQKVSKVINTNGEIRGQFIKELTIDEAHIKDASITNAKIRDASIDSAKIGEAQIKSAHIDRAQIETAHIKDANITSAKIGEAQIKSAHIDEAQILSSHIGTAQIKDAHLGTAVIKSAHIEDASITTAKIKDASITSAKIGNAEIKSANIEDASITSAKIKDASITSAKIGEAEIKSANIGYGQIETAHIKDANITSAKIGEAQIKTAHIDDAQITTAKIADAQITSAKIADAQITSAKIGEAQIKNAHIYNGSIDNAKIADATIESAKIKSLNAEKITTGFISADRIGANSITVNHLSSEVGRTLDISSNEAISLFVRKDGVINGINITPEEITIQANRIGILGEANIGNAIIGNAHIKDGAIDSAKIGEAQITTAHIGEAQITNAKIATGAIGTANIELGAITTALIAESAIKEAQIADASITTAKIVSLTADKIVGNTLDTSKVTIQGANGKIRLVNNRLQVFDNQTSPKERVSIGDVNGDGTVYGFRLRGADGTTILMDENGVKKEGITDGSITNEKISNDADIEGSKLLDNSVDGTKIVVDSITAREIKAKSITGNEIVANSITAGELATGTITAESGVIGSLDASKITTGTMSADRIQGGTLDVGGESNGNGQIAVLDSTGTVITKLDNAGITMNKGSIVGSKMALDVTNGKMILGTNNVNATSGYKLKFDGTNLLLGDGAIAWSNLDSTSQNNISPVNISVTGGVRNFSFDSNGVNQTTPTAYSVSIVRNGSAVTPTSYAWTCGGVLSGTSSTATFTPTVSSYSAVDTWVQVVITVDNRTYTERIPIALSRVGNTGATGTPASIVDIRPSALFFKSTTGANGVFEPEVIFLYPTFQEVTYANWQYSINGGATWISVTEANGLTVGNFNSIANTLCINRTSNLYTDTVTSISFRCNSNKAEIYDTVSIAKLYDVVDLEIGGRNLIKNSLDIDITGTDFPDATTRVYDPVTKVTTITKTGAGYWNAYQWFEDKLTEEVYLDVGQEYVVSADFRTEDLDDPFMFDWNIRSPIYPNQYGEKAVIQSTGGVWKRYSSKLTIQGEGTATRFLFDLTGTTTGGGKIEIRRIKLEKGNKSSDWIPAPEDMDSQISEVRTSADTANQAISDLSSDNIITPSEKINLKREFDIVVAGHTSVVNQANVYSSYSNVVTALNNYNTNYNTLYNNINPLFSSMSTNSSVTGSVIRDYFSSYYSSKENLLLAITNQAQALTSTASYNASNAKAYTDAVKNNFGYEFVTDVIVYGDSDKYYPVIIKGGEQDVKREIMVKRSYHEQAPDDWNTAIHKGGLTVVIKTNFGAWGGANYSWALHDLEEMYTRTFAGCVHCGDGMMFAIFLRGGGETGAIYHLYSDQSLTTNSFPDTPDGTLPAPQIAMDSDLIFYHDDGNGNIYTGYAPAYRTLTSWVEKEIRDKLYIKASQSVLTAIDNMSDDSVITVPEKLTLKREFDIIVAERPNITNQATPYSSNTSVSSALATYNIRYTSLYNFVNPIVADLTTDTSASGTTLRTNFSDYYSSREALQTAILNATKSYTDSSIETASNEYVMLSNESQFFVADSNGVPTTTSVVLDVLGYKGTTQQDTSIGTITGLPNAGMTATVSNNNTQNTKITIAVTTALTSDVADYGVLTIPITIAGKTINKKFSWSKSKDGVKGDQGNPGSNGKTYVLNITNGTRAIIYDANGVNPTPSMTAFGAELYENGTLITSGITYSWSVASSNSLISGTSTIPTFTPTLASSFDASKGNNVVYLTATYGGQIIRQSTPIAVTKIGNTGATGASGSSGSNGKTYILNIINGTRTVLYDANGANPTPSMTAFSCELYEDGVKVTPTSYAWTTPSSGSMLSGNGTASTFTPTLATSFNGANANNIVSLTVTYNGQTIKDTESVAITRIGNTGATGGTGAPGSNGKTYILNVLGGTRTITYDTNGVNPIPSMTAFSCELYENGTLVTPTSYTWSTPTTGSLLSNPTATTGSTFTPIVATSFDATKANNIVSLTVAYNGQIIKDTVSVSIVKIGNKGDKGDQGIQGNSGNSGYTYVLNVLNGTRAITYDASGATPNPSTATAFSCTLTRDGTAVTPTYSWSASGCLSGTSTSATFTPTISSAFSTANTYVTLTATHNGNSISQTVPVAIVKDATGLDWVNDWTTGATSINGDKVITPRIFAGTNSGTSTAPNLTGLAIGKDVMNGTENKIGMVLYKNNNAVFQLKDDGSIAIGMAGKDQITLDADGNAVLPQIRTNQIIVTGDSTLDDKLAGLDNEMMARKMMYIDSKTDYLFHFDKDLCSTNGLHPDSGYQLELQEFSGKYAGAVQVSPSTVNLVGNAELLVYNNYFSTGAITTTGEQLSNETLFNQPIHRISYTVANETGLNAMANAGGKGIYINTVNILTFLADTRYACSIYWRPVNKSDVSVSGTPSNMGNMMDGGTVYIGNGWYRTTSYRDGSVTTNKTDDIFFGFKCPSAVVGETVMIDWCCPQIEQGRSVATRYVYDNHTADNLTYTLPNELSDFTVCFWAKNVTYGLSISKMFMGFANADKSKYINIHNGWGNDWYLGDEISQTANALTSFSPINTANYYFVFTRSSAVCTLSIYNESGELVYSTAKTIDGFTYKIKHISIGKGFSNLATAFCYIDEVYITPRIAISNEQLALANLAEPLTDLNSGTAPPIPSSVRITIN